MTPKEKAEELVIKFTFQRENHELYVAKQCALIAVDEIVKSLIMSTGHLLLNEVDSYQIAKYFKYLDEVKQEIEKL